jgi:hypothetical protein
VGEEARPGQSIRRPAAHPEHDAVAREVSGWFTASAPEIGYEVSERWYGYRSDLGTGQARVILRAGEPGQVPAALADAAAGGAGTLTIWVDTGSGRPGWTGHSAAPAAGPATRRRTWPWSAP